MWLCFGHTGVNRELLRVCQRGWFPLGPVGEVCYNMQLGLGYPKDIHSCPTRSTFILFRHKTLLGKNNHLYLVAVL